MPSLHSEEQSQWQAIPQSSRHSFPAFCLASMFSQNFLTRVHQSLRSFTDTTLLPQDALKLAVPLPPTNPDASPRLSNSSIPQKPSSKSLTRVLRLLVWHLDVTVTCQPCATESPRQSRSQACVAALLRSIHLFLSQVTA